MSRPRPRPGSLANHPHPMPGKLTNNFDAVRLLSLRKLAMAAEFPQRDHGGPYAVAQNGYDPQDPMMTPEDFLLGRSGTWLAAKWFVRLPLDARRREYLFSTAAEVVQLMEDLPHEVAISRPGADADQTTPPPDDPLNQLVGHRGGA